MNTSATIETTKVQEQSLKSFSAKDLFKAKCNLLNELTMLSLKEAWGQRVKERGLAQALRDNSRLEEASKVEKMTEAEVTAVMKDHEAEVLAMNAICEELSAKVKEIEAVLKTAANSNERALAA
jgi:hypothetical protein